MTAAHDGARMVLGPVVVDARTAPQTVDAVAARLDDGAAAPLAVGSVNLDHLHHFRRAQPLGRPGGPEWLWLADGAPIARRGRRLSGAAWPRVTGADLLPALLEQCARTGATVGFFGGQAEMHDALRAQLTVRYPGLRIAGTWAPERAEVTDDVRSAVLAAEVAAAGVDVLVVGLGKPRQELWIDRHGAATGARVLLAFGAAADFLAGSVRRAPKFMQDNGIEWLYRLGVEPRRLARRYLVQGPPALLALRRARLERPTSTAASTQAPQP